jgi:hypothetical protein
MPEDRKYGIEFRFKAVKMDDGRGPKMETQWRELDWYGSKDERDYAFRHYVEQVHGGFDRSRLEYRKSDR